MLIIINFFDYVFFDGIKFKKNFEYTFLLI